MPVVEDVLAHFGIKGMKWGVRKPNPGGTTGPGRRVQKLNRKIAVNESIAKNARSRAKLHERDLADLEKRGLQSAPMQKRYGRDLVENNFVFATLHSMSKNNALSEMKTTAIRNANTEHAVASRADSRAEKLKKKKDDLEHGEIVEDDDDNVAATEDFFEHFGVKGMKWGVKRAEAKRASSSEDANSASDAASKAKKAGGTHALSNKELQDLVTRMNLERQFNTLKPESKAKAATKFIADVLVSAGKQQATKLAQEQLAKQVASLLKK